MQIQISPSSLEGCAEVPPSKSLAHRAVLCAALSDGRCTVSNLDFSQDICATLSAVEQAGCRVLRGPNRAVFVPLGGFGTVRGPIDCGESGSTLRFLIPLLSLTGQTVRFTGRGRLMARPQQVYAELLPAHSTRFVQDAAGIEVAGALEPGQYTLPGNVSSQFVSGLLFALPLLEGPSRLRITPPIESRSYIEITRSVQALYGIQSEWLREDELYIPGRQRYRARDFTVEGDYSQAAFLAVLGSLTGHIALSGLPETTRQGDGVILEILARCGVPARWEGSRLQCAAGRPAAASIDLADCPDLGPVLMALACCCTGTTVIENAARLRLKESDRIAAMEAELAKFGASVSSDENTVTIRGGALHAPREALSSHNDHRIAMSLAVLALAAGVPAVLGGAEAVNKSWPAFWDVLRGLGATIEEVSDAEPQ